MGASGPAIVLLQVAGVRCHLPPSCRVAGGCVWARPGGLRFTRNWVLREPIASPGNVIRVLLGENKLGEKADLKWFQKDGPLECGQSAIFS